MTDFRHEQDEGGAGVHIAMLPRPDRQQRATQTARADSERGGPAVVAGGAAEFGRVVT